MSPARTGKMDEYFSWEHVTHTPHSGKEGFVNNKDGNNEYQVGRSSDCHNGLTFFHLVDKNGTRAVVKFCIAYDTILKI